MKKQRKSTTLRGAEPGTGKSNTIKGIQATPYIDTDKWINQRLLKDGKQVGLFDPKYKGMSVKQIWDLLEPPEGGE